MWDIVVMSLTVSLLYGISPFLHKHIYNTNKISYYTLLFISATVFFLCTIAVLAVKHKIIIDDIKTLSKNKYSLPLLVLSAILSIFLANLLYFKVLKNERAKSYIVSAVIFTSPLFTFILSYMFMTEGITFISFFGVALITSGVITLGLGMT